MVVNILAAKALSRIDPVYFVMFMSLCFQIDLNNYFTHVSVFEHEYQLI